MAKGQKYNDDLKEKARALLAVNSSSAFVARELRLPESTIRTWKKLFEKESGSESFAELRQKKKEDFVKQAWTDIELANSILHRRLERAANDEAKLDDLLNAIVLSSETNLEEKKALVAQICSLKLMDISKVCTAIGLLYDKQALASKDATTVVEGNVKFEDM